VRNKPIARDEVRLSGRRISTLPLGSVTRSGQAIERLWTPLLRELNLRDDDYPYALGRPRECMHCGKKYRQAFDARRYYKNYCSDRCVRLARNAAQSKRISNMRAKARDGRNCETCGEPIDARRSTMRFCSAKCRVVAHRLKAT
jgi:endogenous inhibitor of DNA gyrase (YacG/DUF329 family)